MSLFMNKMFLMYCNASCFDYKPKRHFKWVFYDVYKCICIRNTTYLFPKSIFMSIKTNFKKCSCILKLKLYASISHYSKSFFIHSEHLEYYSLNCNIVKEKIKRLNLKSRQDKITQNLFKVYVVS